MTKLMKEHSKTVGLPPGTLVYVGDRKAQTVTITVIDYDEAAMHERIVETPEECREYLDKSTVTWINVTGLHDMDMLQRFGSIFGIHPLVLEDVVNTGQRPRMEDYADYLFIVLKMLYRKENESSILAEQISVILGRNYVLSFQEAEGDVFDVIRDRIRAAKGRIRKRGCDYLAYSLLDAIVDNYFIVLEEIAERIEIIQEEVATKARQETLQAIHALKREMIFMRKALWPLRELVSALEKSDSKLIQRSAAPYLRDVYEHTIQVIDTIESLRDMLGGALDIYMTTVSNRMNEVMKVLTVIATIFMPLTFMAGIYGMNFENMPELKWRYGYLGILMVMLLLGIGMVTYFKRKKWL
ncbi:magnesium/cobalt transporter CorA [Verrucomicrobiota bacterium]